MLTVPKDSEGLFAVALVVMVAKHLGKKLAKNMNYALCKTVNDPRELNCPNRVYGAGFSPDQAISAAKLYSKKGDAKEECENYEFTKEKNSQTKGGAGVPFWAYP